jgi:4-amino-4-deoxy-L-arabinose transferase-like glycosyltransferase
MQQIDIQDTTGTTAGGRYARRRPAPTAHGFEERRGFWYWALAIVVAATVARLLLAAITPLVPDEALYWEWSRQLAPGYFAHPPVIALLIRAGTEVFGATPFGVRVFPVLTGFATMLVVVWLARRHGGTEAAFWAAAIGAAVPVAAVGLVLATPDSPLLLAYALTIAALDQALRAQPGSRTSWTWWILAGVAVGFGLTSKYSAVLIPLGVLLAFLLRASLRRRLRTPEPYTAASVALLCFSPVIWWDAQHGWASFGFQLSRGLHTADGRWISRAVQSLVEQMALVSPVLAVLLVAVAVRAVRRRTDDRRFVLAVVSLTTLGFFAYQALNQRIEPNWPAPGFVPAFVLLALAAQSLRWRRWIKLGVGMGAVLVAVMYVQVGYPLLPVEPRKDPVARAHGWDTLAETAQQVRAQVAAGGAVTTWVGANRYQDAAQLAFHLPDQPTVFLLNLTGWPSQYDFWPGFWDRARPGDALLLVMEESPETDEALAILRPHFDGLTREAEVALRRGAGVISERQVWVLRGWKGSWPE